MSPKNRELVRRHYAAGSSIGRIARALNLTVMAVAFELHRGE